MLAAAYPWVARRLLTERSPELQATLTALLYKDGRFDFERMESLIVQAVKPVGRRRLTPRPAGTMAAGALCTMLSVSLATTFWCFLACCARTSPLAKLPLGGTVCWGRLGLCRYPHS